MNLKARTQKRTRSFSPTLTESPIKVKAGKALAGMIITFEFVGRTSRSSLTGPRTPYVRKAV